VPAPISSTAFFDAPRVQALRRDMAPVAFCR
jgi:hypothetical protein